MGKVVERADWFELILEAIDEAIHVVDDRGMTIFTIIMPLSLTL